LDDDEEEYKVLALVPWIELAEGVCYGWHLDAAEYSVQMYEYGISFLLIRSTEDSLERLRSGGSSGSCLDAVREARLGGCPWVCVPRLWERWEGRRRDWVPGVSRIACQDLRLLPCSTGSWFLVMSRSMLILRL
jgi:hypothetical protein